MLLNWGRGGWIELVGRGGRFEVTEKIWDLILILFRKKFQSNHIKRFGRKLLIEKFPKIVFFLCKNQKKVQVWWNFAIFSNFMVVFFLAEISNNFCFCKLDESLRNFCSWQFFVFVTVLKTFGFQKWTLFVSTFFKMGTVAQRQLYMVAYVSYPLISTVMMHMPASTANLHPLVV